MRLETRGVQRAHTFSFLPSLLRQATDPRRKRDSGCGGEGGQARHFQDFWFKTGMEIPLYSD